MRPSSPETPNRGRSRVGGRRSTWPWQNCSSQFNCAQLTYLLVDPLDVPAPLAIAQQQGLRAFIAVDQHLRPGGASGRDGSAENSPRPVTRTALPSASSNSTGSSSSTVGDGSGSCPGHGWPGSARGTGSSPSGVKVMRSAGPRPPDS